MLKDMASYMQNNFASVPGYTTATFPHTSVTSLYWWDWNANSGDTGGIVENDWVTVRPSPLSASRLPGVPLVCYTAQVAFAHSGSTLCPHCFSAAVCTR